MNATDLATMQWLSRLTRRSNAPAAPHPAAGNRPGGLVEPPPEAPARPATTGLPDHVVAHVLRLVTEYGGLAYQGGQFAHLAAQAGADRDPCGKSQHEANGGHATALRATYYDEIRDYLRGVKS